MKEEEESMKVAILDKKVRRNIALFKHLVDHQAVQEKARFYQLAGKAYKAFLNCKSGELRFFDLEKQDLPKGEWKSIQILFQPSKGEGAFSVSSEEKGSFSCEELNPGAYALFTKTLHILNQICYDPKQEGNPFWVLRQITDLDFELTKEEEGKQNLLQEAWHDINREEAEKLLQKHPMGTYLFRKGQFAQSLELVLNRNFPVPIRCFTLTLSDWGGRISERTLIWKDEQWLFYNDDPTLSGPAFGTTQELLATLGDQLQKPLFATES